MRKHAMVTAAAALFAAMMVALPSQGLGQGQATPQVGTIDGTIILIQCRNTNDHIRVQNTSPLPIDLPGACATLSDCTGCLNTLIEESGCEINEAAPPLHAIEDDIQFILGCD